jgi:hypothetical protein
MGNPIPVSAVSGFRRACEKDVDRNTRNGCCWFIPFCVHPFWDAGPILTRSDPSRAKLEVNPPHFRRVKIRRPAPILKAQRRYSRPILIIQTQRFLPPKRGFFISPWSKTFDRSLRSSSLLPRVFCFKRCYDLSCNLVFLQVPKFSSLRYAILHSDG